MQLTSSIHITYMKTVPECVGVERTQGVAGEIEMRQRRQLVESEGLYVTDPVLAKVKVMQRRVSVEHRRSWQHNVCC